MSDEISEALNKYLETYLSKRDLAATLKMLNINCSGYGTGFGEKGFNLKEVQALYKRDVEQVLQSIDYKVYNIHTQLFDNSCGYSACELNLNFYLSEQEVKFKHLRLSIFWRKETEEWKIAHMHLSFPTNIHEADESYPVKELEDRNKALQRLVAAKTQDLNEALKKLTLLATIDNLTNLYNRHKIQELLEQEIDRANRYKNRLSIIIVDIDFFKEVNDSAGHNIGDIVLSEFANIMSKNTRTSDICGRWGGEEFLIISPEATSSDALKIAEKIQKAVNSHVFETNIKLTASYGIATFTSKLSLKDLVKNADDALYYSKRQCRIKITVS